MIRRRTTGSLRLQLDHPGSRCSSRERWIGFSREVSTGRDRCRPDIPRLGDEAAAATAQDANMTARLSAALATCLLATPLTLWSAPASATVPTCFGQPATIVGTDGPDDLIGQSGVADVIYGGGGNDRISGGAFYEDDDVPGHAADLLCGGPGDDGVSGGPGDDRINGGDGNDFVRGRAGADVVQGNAGNDTVRDETFADMDRMNDLLRGGSGDDYMTTAWGIDKAYGGTGNDTIIDLECDPSYLYGGAGSDTFESWSSSFEGWHGSYCLYAADVINGGEHYDTAQSSSLDRVTAVENNFRVVQ
jgi:Ca2+-binding RTX toxin-like protein